MSWIYNFREASLGDLDFIILLTEVTFRLHVEESGEIWEPKQRSLWKSKIKNEIHNIIEIQWESIGLYTIQEQGSTIELDLLFLLPAFQGIWIGTDILDKLLKNAQSKHKTVHLKVFKTNTWARKLYEKMGFKITYSTDVRDYMKFSSN